MRTFGEFRFQKTVEEAEHLAKSTKRKGYHQFLLGGGFKHFLFSTLFGEDSHFD